MADGIHDHSGIVRCGQLTEFHFAGFRIDGDLGDLGGKCGHRRVIIVTIHGFACDGAAESREQIVPALTLLGFLMYQDIPG